MKLNILKKILSLRSDRYKQQWNKDFTTEIRLLLTA